MPSPATALHPSETGLTAGFEGECVELFSGFLHVLGLPKSVGAIYGLLFASPEPLCFADIVARLDMSKGSVRLGTGLLASKRSSETG